MVKRFVIISNISTIQNRAKKYLHSHNNLTVQVKITYDSLCSSISITEIPLSLTVSSIV